MEYLLSDDKIANIRKFRSERVLNFIDEQKSERFELTYCAVSKRIRELKGCWIYGFQVHDVVSIGII